VFRVLEELGYKPIIVGTYALILQGWLPRTYLGETKDVDIYVNNPTVLHDERLAEKLASLGLTLGKSDAGGIYVNAEKPVEILYPIHDIYIPEKLLECAITVSGIRVLEGHAVLIAKALGSDISFLAKWIRTTGVEINEEKLYTLLESVAEEVPPELQQVLARRIRTFITTYRSPAETRGEAREV